MALTAISPSRNIVAQEAAATAAVAVTAGTAATVTYHHSNTKPTTVAKGVCGTVGQQKLRNVAVDSEILTQNWVAEEEATPTSMMIGAEELADDVLLDELSTRFQGVLPIQPSPLLLAPDYTPCSLKSTLLNGHLIYCFVIGGECRLCFPQIISVVLQGVRMSEVNELFTTLNIHISVASPQQLETLKLAGVMPMTADSCGLVTKSDAERLISKLLPQSSGPLRVEVSRTDAVSVVHDCFGGCRGTLLPSLSSDERIECSECKLMFTGEKFVSHSHSTEQIRRICHWGFDSSNWKHYLHLPESQENDVKAGQRLELFKYPPVRLGKRSASNGVKTLENNICSKVANLATTSEGAGTMTAPTPTVPSQNDFKEQFVKLRTFAETASATATASIIAEPPATATVGHSSVLCATTPSYIPTDYAATSLQSSDIAGICSSQLQSLLELQFAASQLPLSERQQQQFTLPPGSNSSGFLCDPTWRSNFEQQQLALSHRKETVDLVEQQQQQNVAAADGICGSEKICTTDLDVPIPAVNSVNSSNNSSIKAGNSFEKLLDETLRGNWATILSVVQLLLIERREKELLLSQNGQLRRENALLRGALANHNDLVGLKEFNAAAKAPVS